MGKKLTRRGFMRAAAMTAAGATLAACQPKTVIVKETIEVEKVVKETVIVEGTPVEVTRIVKETVVVEKAPPAEEIIEITVAMGEHPAQPIIQDAPAHLALTEHTGVKLNFITAQGEDYSAKQQVWLATDQVPDLMRVNLPVIQDYAGEGVLLPLMPLINEHAPNLKRYIDTHWEVFKKLTVGGEIYHIPIVDYNMKNFGSQPMIRIDILEELGLETPTNFDELFEVLKAFKKAYPDSVIWANRLGTRRLLSLNAYSMGSGFGTHGTATPLHWEKDVDGGKWLFGPIHPEFKDVLDYFARAYAEGILDPDFAVTPSDRWHEKNSSGEALYCWENMSFGVRWNFALREVNPEAAWAPIYVLEGKKGKRMPDYSGVHQPSGYVIGANTKYPERIIKLMDWMVTPLGLDVTNWGVEGVHYNYVKGSRPETIEDYTVAGLDKAMDPTKKELLPEVYEEFAQKTDPFREYQSATGTGLLDFMMICDAAVWDLWTPPGELDDWYELAATDPGLHPAPFAPPFTKEESQRIKDILTNVDAILDPAYDKVIIGEMSLAEYDQAVEQAIEAGAEELETIYNAAEARLK